jgi:hypothetical protein
MATSPKYYGEQDPAVHGGPRGYPLRLDRGRVSVPSVRQGQYEQARVVLDFKAAEFRTWEPESLAAYMKIMDRIANRQFFLRHQDRRYDDESRGYRFWVEWLQPYETPSPEAPR